MMKTKILNIISAIALVFSLVACSDDHVSDLQLSGDCMIEAISLDNFEGKIDLASRSIVVRLPEVYETSAMTVTELSISDGAICNVELGETLNMDAAKVLHVQNGDVFLDWTLSVLHDEARITSFTINDVYTGTINQDAKTITVNREPRDTNHCGGVETSFISCDDVAEDGSALFRLLAIVLNVVTYGVGAAAVLGVVITGYQYITARDNNVAQVAKAKNRMLQIVIGLAIWIVFWGVLQFLLPGGLFGNGQ